MSSQLLLNRPIAIFVILLVTASATNSQVTNRKPQLANRTRSEFLHAWNGYKKYAWGHDDLRPLTRTYHDWYGQSLLMTPVDALDTMILMGLNREARSTREYIVENLSFDKDIEVQNFEITIRLLGGLLSSYQLTRDPRLLHLAENLGDRLLPVFNSPTGLPYRYVNLRTGKVRDAKTNPAEAGTLLIEFGTLSKLTHRPVFYEKAKRALVAIYKRRSSIGLVGTWINVETGEWIDTDSHVSGAIDSYYEYLLKCWLLFDDEDCHRMWLDSIDAINKYLSDEVEPSQIADRRLLPDRAPASQIELWYGHADMNTGKRTMPAYGALDAFFPAVLALSGDFDRARRLQASCFKMWQQHGIEPEEINYRTMTIESPGYPLRPEIVESTYYLYHYSQVGKHIRRRPGRLARGAPGAQPAILMGRGDEYLQMGETLFKDFVKHCRTPAGYASLKSVITKTQADSMQSFVFAETFKYFYLLFAPAKALNFDEVIFNTEAHPIRRTSK